MFLDDWRGPTELIIDELRASGVAVSTMRERRKTMDVLVFLSLRRGTWAVLGWFGLAWMGCYWLLRPAR
jgi:hypothetical protein